MEGKNEERKGGRKEEKNEGRKKRKGIQKFLPTVDFSCPWEGNVGKGLGHLLNCTEKLLERADSGLLLGFPYCFKGIRYFYSNYFQFCL